MLLIINTGLSINIRIYTYAFNNAIMVFDCKISCNYNFDCYCGFSL